ncbi:hypothetical protein [Rufibacter roseus]|uniref:Uncharacterized protein n=1 Tax=Rufibacter roseus TaxID=1567108 RepID=A0ABW2DLB3_9BACT|nr:hypothetical protein [Rufibacter roseus]
MKNVTSRQTVAPVSFRCKLSTLVPYLRQLSAQRQAAAMQPRMSNIRIAS